jgi:hypothetical protein
LPLRKQQVQRSEPPLSGAHAELRHLRAAFHLMHDEILYQSFPGNCSGQRLDAGGCLLADIQRRAAQPSVRDVFDLRFAAEAGFQRVRDAASCRDCLLFRCFHRFFSG